MKAISRKGVIYTRPLLISRNLSEVYHKYVLCQSTVGAIGSLGFAVIGSQIWVRERAFARSRTQIWDSNMGIPKNRAIHVYWIINL